MIGVIPHERGQVEGNRESAAAMFEQIFVALVGLFRRSEAGELAHGEKFSAVSGGVNAARIRRLAGVAEILVLAPVRRKISLSVEAANGHAGNGGEAGVAVLIEVRAGSRTDRAL